MTGTVKWFNEEKGYGFITPDEPVEGLPADKDLFVHFRDIKPAYDMRQDDRVEFVVVEGPRGLMAREVTRMQS